MPVETLHADRMVRQVSSGAAFTSTMPFRILNKGPEYFRRQLEPNSKKLSAVERLEADKAKYVKSQQVVSTKQEPVRPPLIKKALMSPGVLRTINTPTRKIPLGLRRGEGCGRRGALNIDILNNLINICDSPLSSSPSPKTETGDCSLKVNATWEKQPDGQPKLSGGYSNLSKVSPNSVTVRRVDVRPNAVQQHPKQRQQQQQQCVRQTAPRVCSVIPPSSPAYTRISSTSSRSSKRGHPSLHRSKSDLSDRYSRATADLERFFNYCGLDPMEIESIGVERFARASSDIVSVKLPSVSTPSSEQSCQTEERASEREPYGISIIERNARVIKWLYGIRQACETQKVSNV